MSAQDYESEDGTELENAREAHVSATGACPAVQCDREVCSRLTAFFSTASETGEERKGRWADGGRTADQFDLQHKGYQFGPPNRRKKSETDI